MRMRMTHANRTSRIQSIALGVLAACGLIGCGDREVKIDENQLAQSRQWMEIQKANEPIPVPAGAREILANEFAWISDIRMSPQQTKGLVVGIKAPRQPGLSPSETFVVNLPDGKILSHYAVHLPHACFSHDERRLAAIGHVPEAASSQPAPSSNSSGRENQLLALSGNDDRPWSYDLRISNVEAGGWQTITGKTSNKIHGVGWNEADNQIITFETARRILSDEELDALPKPEPNELLDLTQAVGNPQVEIKFWSGETGQLLSTVVGPQLNADSVAVSDDGRMAAIWDSKVANSIVVCETSTGKELYRLEGLDHSTIEVAFSPGNRFVATRDAFEKGMEFTRIVVWNLETGRRVSEIDSHAARMIFSPDDRLLATANVTINEDKAFRWDVSVWDAKQGTEVKTLEPGGEDLRVAFLSNHELITTSNFGNNDLNSRVFVWDIANQD